MVARSVLEDEGGRRQLPETRELLRCFSEKNPRLFAIETTVWKKKKTISKCRVFVLFGVTPRNQVLHELASGGSFWSSKPETLETEETAWEHTQESPRTWGPGERHSWLQRRQEVTRRLMSRTKQLAPSARR